MFSKGNRLISTVLLLTAFFFIWCICHEESSRAKNDLPSHYAEIDSLYVWARDKR